MAVRERQRLPCSELDASRQSPLRRDRPHVLRALLGEHRPHVPTGPKQGTRPRFFSVKGVLQAKSAQRWFFSFFSHSVEREGDSS